MDANTNTEQLIPINLNIYKHTLPKQIGNIKLCAFSPTGQQMATYTAPDQSLKIWTLNGNCVTTLNCNYKDINFIDFSRNGQYVLYTFCDGTVNLWNEKNLSLETLTDTTDSAVFSPNGMHIITTHSYRSGTYSNMVKIWNLNGYCLANLDCHQQWIKSVKISHDAKLIATILSDNTIKIWKWNIKSDRILTRGQCVATLNGNVDLTTSGSFSNDNKKFIMSSSDNAANIWDITTGKCITKLIGHQCQINSATFSSNGELVATTSSDHSIKIWDLNGTCRATLVGHQSPVVSAIFSTNGLFISTVAVDGSAMLWDIFGNCLINITGNNSVVTSTYFDDKDNCNIIAYTHGPSILDYL